MITSGVRLAGEYLAFFDLPFYQYLVVVHLGTALGYLAYTAATSPCKAGIGYVQALGQQFAEYVLFSLYGKGLFLSAYTYRNLGSSCVLLLAIGYGK